MKRNFIGHILAEILKDCIYDPFMKKDMTILEVGGNVGIVTLYFSQYAKKLYVMEPSQYHLKCLRKTVNFNKLKNVTIIPKALNGVDGHKTFYHNDNNTTTFSLKEPIMYPSTEVVDCISIGTLIKKYKIDNIDFMKLDVEGSEIDILESESFRKEASRIRALTVEHHAWCGHPENKIVDLLVQSGFKCKKLKSDAPIYYGERP